MKLQFIKVLVDHTLGVIFVMARNRKKQPTGPERPSHDELVDVLLILARYLDSKGLQEMTLKMNDGRRIGVKLEEDFWSLYRPNDEKS